MRVIKTNWYNGLQLIGRKYYLRFMPFGLRIDVPIGKSKYNLGWEA